MLHFFLLLMIKIHFVNDSKSLDFLLFDNYNLIFYCKKFYDK